MRLLYIIILTACCNTVFSQVRYFDERYISTLALLNPVIINPGATGAFDTHQIIVNYKNKWASFPDSPKSYHLSYDGPIAERLGFGVLAAADTNGALTTTKIQGSLAYTIQSVKNKISAGFSAEYINHGLSGDVLTHKYIDQGDAIITERELGNGFFDVSVGAYGVYNKVFTYGIAFPSLVSSRIDQNSDDQFTREVGFILNAGYIYKKPGSDVVFEPSIFVKQLNNVPFHVDVNLLGRFADDRFRGGISYTIEGDQKIGFIIGTAFNAMNINYSYNASRHAFQTYNNGTHEFSLRFDISGDRKLMDIIPDEDTIPVLEGIDK